MRLVVVSLMLCWLSLLGACSDSPSESGQENQPQTVSEAPVPVDVESRPTTSLPRVLESFGIGENVYARSLVYEPEHNAVWIGTSVGVHEVDLTSRDVRNTYTRDDGLANEYIFAMLVDKRGGKWFGSNGGGASRLQEGQWQTFFPLHGLADYWVYAFAEQASGAVWIGTWNGVTRYEPDNGRFTTYVKELVNEWVYGVVVDQQDRVWFGTEGGVSMFDGQLWRSWTHDDGLGAPNSAGLPVSTNTGLGTRSRHDLNVMVEGRPSYNPNYVFCLFIDSDNQVWAGTWGGGVSRFDGQQWISLTSRDGLAGDIVFSITQDEQGAMWFGTQRGISRYDGQHWQTLGREQGITTGSVYSIAAMPGGEVWAGTRGSVVRIGQGS
jgi:ligand-binding sensor domain-containing protein